MKAKIIGIIVTAVLSLAIIAVGIVISVKNSDSENNRSEDVVSSEIVSPLENEVSGDDGNIVFETGNEEKSEASDEETEIYSTSIITEGTLDRNIYIDDETLNGGKFQWR